jgi:hypothetical protein
MVGEPFAAEGVAVMAISSAEISAINGATTFDAFDALVLQVQTPEDMWEVLRDRSSNDYSASKWDLPTLADALAAETRIFVRGAESVFDPVWGGSGTETDPYMHLQLAITAADAASGDVCIVVMGSLDFRQLRVEGSDNSGTKNYYVIGYAELPGKSGEADSHFRGDTPSERIGQWQFVSGKVWRLNITDAYDEIDARVTPQVDVAGVEYGNVTPTWDEIPGADAAPGDQYRGDMPVYYDPLDDTRDGIVKSGDAEIAAAVASLTDGYWFAGVDTAGQRWVYIRTPSGSKPGVGGERPVCIAWSVEGGQGTTNNYIQANWQTGKTYVGRIILMKQTKGVAEKGPRFLSIQANDSVGRVRCKVFCCGCEDTTALIFNDEPGMCASEMGVVNGGVEGGFSVSASEIAIHMLAWCGVTYRDIQYISGRSAIGNAAGTDATVLFNSFSGSRPHAGADQICYFHNLYLGVDAGWGNQCAPGDSDLDPSDGDENPQNYPGLIVGGLYWNAGFIRLHPARTYFSGVRMKTNDIGGNRGFEAPYNTISRSHIVRPEGSGALQFFAAEGSRSMCVWKSLLDIGGGNGEGKLIGVAADATGYFKAYGMVVRALDEEGEPDTLQVFREFNSNDAPVMDTPINFIIGFDSGDPKLWLYGTLNNYFTPQDTDAANSTEWDAVYGVGNTVHNVDPVLGVVGETWEDWPYPTTSTGIFNPTNEIDTTAAAGRGLSRLPGLFALETDNFYGPFGAGAVDLVTIAENLEADSVVISRRMPFGSGHAISSQTPAGAFRIDGGVVDGVVNIAVQDPSKIDYESATQHAVTVQVSFGGEDLAVVYGVLLTDESADGDASDVVALGNVVSWTADDGLSFILSWGTSTGTRPNTQTVSGRDRTAVLLDDDFDFSVPYFVAVQRVDLGGEAGTAVEVVSAALSGSGVTIGETEKAIYAPSGKGSRLVRFVCTSGVAVVRVPSLHGSAGGATIRASGGVGSVDLDVNGDEAAYAAGSGGNATLDWAAIE